MDCFMMMKTTKEKSIPLIVTDPPYGIDFQGYIAHRVR